METFINSFWGSVDWTWRMISFDVEWNNNYFYGLIIISLIAWGLELAFPWRKNQAAIRKDFWLDGFYMFFNFFVFSIVISGVYQLLSNGFESIGVTMQSIGLIDLSPLHSGLGLLVFFIINDFVQWFCPSESSLFS